MTTEKTDLITQNKVFVLLAGITGIILSIPLIAMQFSEEVDWKLFDFIVMGALIFGMGTLFVAISRVVPHKYRLLVGLGILAALLLMWVHLSVGIVDTWPLAGS